MPTKSKIPGGRRAFTLVEMLVAVTVLVLLIAFIGQMFNSTSDVTKKGNKHMDADAQSRAVFDRMSVDFTQMVKRPDVDYFLKTSTAPSGLSVPPGSFEVPQPGNDQMAFYSQVPGFYSSPQNQSPVSVVAYRVNSSGGGASLHKLERLGTGLAWNGGSSPDASMVFLPRTIASTWPEAANMNPHPHYELAGPQIFRMEYYYILKAQSESDPSILSATPWDTRPGIGHTWMNGLKDVAAIVVTLAIMDSQSSLLVTDAQLGALAESMRDYSPDTMPELGDLEVQWQTAIDAAPIPKPAAASIRIYRRAFYLNSNSED